MTFTWHCEDCGVDLPGIRLNRVKRNPVRRCAKCFAATRDYRTVNADGYIQVTLRDGTKVHEHRLVAEKMLGRKLRRGETVHHRNENRADNRESNLLIYPNPGRHVIDAGHIGRGRDGKFRRVKR